jgi:hypothetical protein
MTSRISLPTLDTIAFLVSKNIQHFQVSGSARFASSEAYIADSSNRKLGVAGSSKGDPIDSATAVPNVVGPERLVLNEPTLRSASLAIRPVKAHNPRRKPRRF